MVMFCTAICFAQKDVTKFLGFPVDGPKSEMINNLKSKGFKLIDSSDVPVLSGRFNGTDVNVYIATENGKVSRIMVCDIDNVSETDIKIRFNKLCRQFSNNSNYRKSEDYIIPDDEDISYEMAVNKKRYEAIFYQQPNDSTIEQIYAEIEKEMAEKYTAEELESSLEASSEKLAALLREIFAYSWNKPVWFMISKASYGKYFISMFYDNEFNRPQGEDL